LLPHALEQMAVSQVAPLHLSGGQSHVCSLLHTPAFWQGADGTQ